MKVSELEHALSFLAEDDDVEFFVTDEDLTDIPANPAHAVITTEVPVLQRGELTPIPDRFPKTLSIHLEIQ